MAKRLYNTKPWRDYRSQVLEENAECAFARLAGECRGALHVHHIDPVSEGGTPFPSEDGTLVVCARHHRQLHWMRSANEPQRKRCPHRHPYPWAREACEAKLNRAVMS